MRRNVSLLAFIWIFAVQYGISASELIITNASREVKLVSQSTNVLHKLSVKNNGKTEVESVDFCFLNHFLPRLSVLEVMDEKDADQKLFQVRPSEKKAKDISCFSAVLNQPLRSGKSGDIQLVATFTQLQKAFPAAIFQNEAQRVLYHDTVHILSPYQVLKQKTKVHLPGTKIESYTEAEPVSHNGKEINFGPYTDVEPFTSEELRLHFENNTPFAVATKMTREIEVSHWGNVYIEEHYVIRHTGAKLRGEFSRLELMKNPRLYAQAAIRGFMATLPKSAHSIYFRDPIGNISTSTVQHGLHALEVVLSPRYPLFGGWSTEFTLGYSVPLGDVVRKSRDGILQFAMLFGSPVMGLVVEDIEIRVVLPEGSDIKGVNSPFEVKRSIEKKFTYLDTHGRPVVVLQRGNIGIEHNVAYGVIYTFSSLSLLQEPLLLIGAFLLLFSLVIAYNRCNFRITKDAKWAEENRAERAAFLLKEIESIVSERKRAIGSVSNPSSIDVQNLQRQFAGSAQRLKKRCGELEDIGAPEQAARIERFLEEDKVLQAKINQITSSASRGLHTVGSSEDRANVASGIQSQLQQVYDEAQRQFDKQIDPLH